MSIRKSIIQVNRAEFIKPKRKMQNVSFRNLDEFFDFLPPDELKMVQFIRQIIFDCIPGCREKLSWNVPFFYKRSAICFLWPSSVTWGNVKQTGTVRLGFTKAYLMRDEMNFLDRGNRKQVYWHDFNNIGEIDVELVKLYLLEAARIDNERGKRKTGNI